MINVHEIVRENLRPLLPDDASLSRATRGVVEKLGFFNGKPPPPPDSRLFDFEGKVNQVVGHFAQDGLKREDYVGAAVKEPDLFVRSPETIISNIEKLNKYCIDGGLTRGDYLRAALARRPSLFCQNPERLIQHIEDGARHFAQSGVTHKSYLRAAIKQPTLFAQSPGTIVSNVDRVVRHFSDAGLTRREYVNSIIKQPSVFYLDPETVIGNIEKVVAHFARDGLTCENYLRAAIKRPSLFHQKPETVIGHVNLIAELYRKGLLAKQNSARTASPEGVEIALGIALTNPVLITLSDENISLREFYAIATAAAPSLNVVKKPRNEVEREIGRALGHPDPKLPIPKIGPDAGVGPHARNLLLRALVREGWVKGETKK